MQPTRMFALAAAVAFAAGSVLAGARPASADLPQAPPDGLFRAMATAPSGLGGPAGVRGPHGSGNPHGRVPLAQRAGAERIARYLELTAAQKEAIRELVEAHRTAVGPLAEERRSLRQQLGGVLEQREPDAAAIGRLVIELKERRQALRASRAGLGERIAEVLVGEQKVKWQHLQELRAAGEPRPLRGHG